MHEMYDMSVKQAATAVALSVLKSLGPDCATFGEAVFERFGEEAMRSALEACHASSRNVETLACEMLCASLGRELYPWQVEEVKEMVALAGGEHSGLHQPAMM